jgi:hypothetical protein
MLEKLRRRSLPRRSARWRVSNSTPDGGHTSAAEKAACLGVFFCASNTINEIRFMDRCHDLGSTDFAYSLAVNLGRALHVTNAGPRGAFRGVLNEPAVLEAEAQRRLFCPALPNAAKGNAYRYVRAKAYYRANEAHCFAVGCSLLLPTMLYRC